eukprot:7071593-Pyramimonas_sp.AAC.1
MKRFVPFTLSCGVPLAGPKARPAWSSRLCEALASLPMITVALYFITMSDWQLLDLSGTFDDRPRGMGLPPPGEARPPLPDPSQGRIIMEGDLASWAGRWIWN